MRALIIVILISGGVAGCVHRDQGGTATESYLQKDAGADIGSIPLDRGGRTGGTGPGGSTVGGTGSAPDR